MYIVWEIRSRPSKKPTDQSSKKNEQFSDSPKSKSASGQETVVSPNVKNSENSGIPTTPQGDFKASPSNGPKRPDSSKKSHAPDPD